MRRALSTTALLRALGSALGSALLTACAALCGHASAARGGRRSCCAVCTEQPFVWRPASPLDVPRAAQLFEAVAVCRAWRRAGKRLFFARLWDACTTICHPLQLFSLVRCLPARLPDTGALRGVLCCS